MNQWELRRKVSDFSALNADDKQEIIDTMFTWDATKHYYYADNICDLIPHLNKDRALDLFEFYAKNYYSSGSNADDDYSIIKNVYDYDKDRVKEIIKDSKSKSIPVTMLVLENISIEDENKGLRALSSRVYSPNILFDNKYKPSLEAIKKLPPIMRLNTLESLSNGKISYNIFENIKSLDEFKSLLFGAVLRYRDRVEAMCNTYTEFQNLGIESVIKINCTCVNCGEYSVSLKSLVARTKIGLQKTNMGDYLLHGSCALCGKYDQIKEFIYPEVK